MVEPQYQELLKEDIPHVKLDGVHVGVIAGQSYGAYVCLFVCLCQYYSKCSGTSSFWLP